MSKSSNSGEAGATRQSGSGKSGAVTEKPEPGGTRDFVVQDIIRRLYCHDLEPGQRLQEAQLADDYGVSRGPIREALYALAAVGVVELQSQRGAHLRVLRLEEAIDALLVIQQLTGFAARQAALQNHDSEAGRRFKACIDSLNDFPSDADTTETSALRERFFLVLSDLANNKELSRILSAVQIHLIRTQYNFLLREIDLVRIRD